jgi:hypothetical protein
MKSGSRTAEVTPESSPSPLHNHLLRWIERKVNPNVVRNPFDAKERQVRRRRYVPDSKLVPSAPKAPNSLLQHLRAEHKANPSGLSILRLPRQPFGCHKTYNDESEFLQAHIVSRDPSPSQVEALDSVTRLWRLIERQNQRKVRYSSLRRKASRFDHYESESGLLICPRDQRCLEAYNNDKAKYRSALFHSFTPAPPRNSHARSLQPSDRLYPKPPSRSNYLARTLTQRFAGLFGETN